MIQRDLDAASHPMVAGMGRRSVAAWGLGLGLAVMLAGCGGGGSDLVAQEPEPCLPHVVINEFARETAASAPEGQQHVQVELLNASSCGAAESDAMTVAIGSQQVAVPAGTWEATEYRIVDVWLPDPVADCPACDRVRLLRATDEVVLDQASFPLTDLDSQYVARAPDGEGSMALVDHSRVTLGGPNVRRGPLIKLTGDSGFRPRDSSANASLTFDGHHWVLGGWSNFAHDVWYSVPDVWKSPDGVSWTLVNASPPYSPYSAFVVFQGRMWALGRTSYSSVDGVEWREEPIVLPLRDRAVVFRNTLVAVTTFGILQSTDGRSWNVIQDTLPWGYARSEPSLLVHEGRLWMIGGTDEPADGPLVFKSDTWSSIDGVNWSRISADAPWGDRRWSRVASYDGKLWLFGGANFDRWPEEFGNASDIWYSTNGTQWYSLDLGQTWGARHAQFLMPAKDGGLLISSGYGNGGVSRMYNDVWKFKLKLYFPKRTGDIAERSTWGTKLDGSGLSPARLDDPDAVFVLRNRARFDVTSVFPGPRLIAGDGLYPLDVDFKVAQSDDLLFYVAGHSTVLSSCDYTPVIEYQAESSSVSCSSSQEE